MVKYFSELKQAEANMCMQNDTDDFAQSLYAY
jgi:hypothetical protein